MILTKLSGPQTFWQWLSIVVARKAFRQ